MRGSKTSNKHWGRIDTRIARGTVAVSEPELFQKVLPRKKCAETLWKKFICMVAI